MNTLLTVLVLALLSAALGAKPKTRFTRYHSWNSRIYPVWKDGDSRYRDCWTGGEVTFDVKNDAPTLTGAKATFNIDLRFPSNQTVLPDGQVVWARNCTVNGTQYRQGQAVYPDQVSGPSGEYSGVFPDGTPFTGTADRKPHYVFVWKTWGRYWQVAGGPSSSLTISTDNVPLGSYNMEVVIYHCRGKNKFIPLGYASTTFSITDQIPFAVSLTQINDVNQADQNFIQNRAIAFSISLHDPSQYLSASDVTFNWDFGDNSGTLISRERQVTHTYLTTGTYRPQVVLMASIPNGCDTPADPTAASPTVMPMDPSGAPAVVVVDSTPRAAPADIALDVPASDVAPAEAADTAAADAAAADADAVDTDAATAEDPAAAETAVEAGATAEDAAADAATAEAAAEPTADDAAATAEGVEVVASAAEDPAVIPATEDPAAVPAVEADATAEDTAAAAVEDPAAVPAVEGATAAPVAPATEEAAAADAAADADAAAADAAADADAAAAAETAVVEATAADVPAIAAAASVAPVAEGEEATVDLAATILPEVPAIATVAPVAEEAIVADAEVVAEVAAATEVAQAETVAPAANVIVPAATAAAAVVEVVPAELEAEVVETVIEVAADATAAPAAVTAPVENEVVAEAEIEADTETQVALVVAKRQAPELTAADDCMIYRYGSFSTAVDVVQGIESVEITQVANVVSQATEVVQNAVDLTITCQGSLPNEVCTIISDADCITPVETICNNVTPSPDCQMILRQFFNDSGVFCINVSLTNDVSLAMASAKVRVTVGSNSSTAGTVAAVLGVMVLVCVVGAIALTYKRFNQYRPLREDSTGGSMGSSGNTSVPMLLWNLLSRQSTGERSPLLQGRVV
ncbi:premelanosome protein a [Coregonus clupeaformis]|uniref:premelanosome protein a n=1 Tax=Coregonus clupeaformis TaxID=59861 RepID=UPI001BE11042|nr:premelanosome protein a [Coregonus clupeaformis]